MPTLLLGEINWAENQLDQLYYPHGIYVDDDHQTIYIADCYNHRIVEWKFGAKTGQVIAGGNGKGDRIDQLSRPTDVIVDKNRNSLIICDIGNRRVVRWSLAKREEREIILSDIKCYGLMMSENGDLYVSDWEKNEVRRWKRDEKEEGTIVAGGNGQGDHLNQLNESIFIFIDANDSLYVSDKENHRVMKWVKNAKEGIVVAGGQGQGESLNQLSSPMGVIVNNFGDVYVADSGNHRIMCWSSGSKEGRVIVGGNGKGEQSNQFSFLRSLSFDVENNLYVVDHGNHRIQLFSVDKS